MPLTVAYTIQLTPGYRLAGDYYADMDSTMKDEDLKKLSDPEWLQANPHKEKLFRKIAARLKPVKVPDNYEMEVLLQALIQTTEFMLDEMPTVEIEPNLGEKVQNRRR